MSNYIVADNWKLVFGIDQTKKGLWRHVNFAEIMARQISKYLTSKSYVFNTPSPELQQFFEKLENENKLQDKINDIIYWSTLLGEIYPYFEKTEKGECRIGLQSSKFKTLSVWSFDELLSITSWVEFLNADNQLLMLQTIWDKQKVRRIYWYQNQKIQMPFNTVNIPEQYRFPEQEANTYGLIPFHRFTNAHPTLMLDWKPATGEIELYNKTFDYFTREMRNNYSKLVMPMNESQRDNFVEALKKGKAKHVGGKMNEGAIFEPDYIIPSNMSDGTQLAQHIPSEIKMQEIHGTLDDMKRGFYNSSGLSYEILTSENATATEVVMHSSNMGQTMNKKRAAYNSDFNIFFGKLFEVFGFKGVDFEFRLSETAGISETDLLNQVILQYQNGLLSRSEAIAIMRSTSTAKAQELMKTIDKEQQELAKLQQETMPEQEQETNEGESKKETQKGTKVKNNEQQKPPR